MEPPPPQTPSLRWRIDEALESGELIFQEIGLALHRTVSQDLGAGLLRLRLLHEKALAGTPVAAGDLAALEQSFAHALVGTRSLAARCRPVGNEANSLMVALHQLAASVNSSTPCQFFCEEPVLIADRVLSSILYRVAEESVQNALRRGARAGIQLRLARGLAEITLSIADQGETTAPANSPNDSQKMLFRARAEMVGAQCHSVVNQEGEVVFTCILPLRSEG